MAKKLTINSIGNEDRFNHITLEKSEVFLDNLQEFIIDIELEKIREYTFDGVSYSRLVYYTLFHDDPKDDLKTKKLKITDFPNGTIVRFNKKDIELLIIFLKDSIKLVFYCNTQKRKKIIKALLKFCKIMKVK